jgi:hypothetical protein
MESKYGYLAGMIDADGCIGIYKRNGYYVPAIQVSNTRQAIIEHCVAILEEADVGYSVVERDRGGNRKKEWILHVAGQPRCRALLDLIGEHIVGKSEQVNLVRTMLELPKGPDRQAEMEKLQQAMSLCNLRGKGHITD